MPESGPLQHQTHVGARCIPLTVAGSRAVRLSPIGRRIIAPRTRPGGFVLSSPAVPTDSEEPRRYVDLERREDRFIIYVRDTRELIEALNTHTRQLTFPDTPVTRTVYFGDVARGLPPGLSIKARSYERERLPGRWDLVPDSKFELLEIKRTVEVSRTPAPSSSHRRPNRAKSKREKTRDTMVEILKLSGSILGRSTYKSKKRKPSITLTDLMRVIGDPKSARKTLDKELYVHLLETVGPFEDFSWLPVIGTEYERTHFVTLDEQYQDVFRATLDTRVTHYAFDKNGDGHIGVPVGTEDFSRFEVKLDEARLANTDLGRLARPDDRRVSRIPDPVQEIPWHDPSIGVPDPARGATKRAPWISGLYGVREPPCPISRS